jgi:hypothetical protein
MGEGSKETVVDLHDARNGEDFISQWRDELRSAVQAAEDFVRENPWRVAALVALVGLGTGLGAGLISARRAERGRAARGGAERSFAGDRKAEDISFKGYI